MPRFYVAGLIVSLAVALIAAVEKSTDSAENHKLTDHSSLKLQLGENATENPAEGFTRKDRPRPSTRECGDHEKWSKCGKACEKTCKRRGSCSVKSCSKEWDGCRCKLGYVRNRKGKCIRPRDCNMCNGSKKKSVPQK